MNILILIGPPGCGKGTLSKHLQRQGYHAISTGELLRDAAKTDPALAEQLAGGSLTDDHTITDLLKQALEGQTQVLLDGYPRTLPQVSLIAEAFPDAEIRALELRLSDDLALQRVARRAEQTGNARPEDRPEVAASRLAVFHEQTDQAIASYRAAGTLLSIDASGSPEEVQRLADAVLDRDH
ncbi:nucleoside monophosphate kinase [Deinococcus altitudinis]|uniref:nucleoside monophosphate kinase n=1 Tax=Deinococcus altitudinis TaxID=468914 RepID=UPI00389184B5